MRNIEGPLDLVQDVADELLAEVEPALVTKFASGERLSRAESHALVEQLVGAVHDIEAREAQEREEMQR